RAYQYCFSQYRPLGPLPRVHHAAVPEAVAAAANHRRLRRLRLESLRLAAIYGGGFAAMELTTILNRCHRFRGFVYEHARFITGKKSIEVVLRPRKGSAAVCSRCHLPAPGYDQLAERRFEFIPLWGFFVFLRYAMRRVDCRRCSVVAVEE